MIDHDSAMAAAQAARQAKDTWDVARLRQVVAKQDAEIRRLSEAVREHGRLLAAIGAVWNALTPGARPGGPTPGVELIEDVDESQAEIVAFRFRPPPA